jgi:acetylglutamate kinase
MDSLYVVKIGGNIIDDDESLAAFLSSFAGLPGKKILVHGGGKLATRMADQLAIPQQMVDGRRITDAETLKVVTMVYAGSINKNIVAKLQSFGCNALGLTGADGNSILAHKRTGSSIDYGYAGDVDSVNTSLLQTLLQAELVPVLAPITHDGKGQLLNTNADTIAQQTALGLATYFQTRLVYCFEKDGVLLDTTDDTSVIPSLRRETYSALKTSGAVHAGMIPKLDAAFKALDGGVDSVLLGNGLQRADLIAGKTGTTIEHG